jgi:hypothetical protein
MVPTLSAIRQEEYEMNTDHPNGPARIAWLRPRNTYGRGGTVTGMGQCHVADCGCAAHP